MFIYNKVSLITAKDKVKKYKSQTINLKMLILIKLQSKNSH
jgi:hypothetical protein